MDSPRRRSSRLAGVAGPEITDVGPMRTPSRSNLSRSHASSPAHSGPGSTQARYSLKEVSSPMGGGRQQTRNQEERELRSLPDMPAWALGRAEAPEPLGPDDLLGQTKSFLYRAGMHGRRSVAQLERSYTFVRSRPLQGIGTLLTVLFGIGIGENLRQHEYIHGAGCVYALVVFTVCYAFAFASRDRLSDASDDEAEKPEMDQAEAVQSGIWKLVMTADRQGIIEAVRADPSVLLSRGPQHGELPMHLMYLFNSPGHIDIAKVLGRRYPQLLPLVYEGDTYKGENCLHIAIVNRNVEMVRFVLDHGDRGELLSTHAVGTFFAEGEPCGYGETALNFAVSTNQKEIVEILVTEYGCDMEREDSLGNNCLHMATRHDLPQIYDLLLRLWDTDSNQAKVEGRPHLMHRENREELTPMRLAAKLGLGPMFNHILRGRCSTFWQYGPVTSTLIPLDDLDRIPGQEDGAVEHILREGHVALLNLTLVQELIQTKWTKFAKRQFQRRFWHTIIYVGAFTLMVISPPVSKLGQEGPWGPEDYAVWITDGVCTTLTLGLAARKLLIEVREMYLESLQVYFGGQGAQMFENTVSLATCSTYIASHFLSMAGLGLAKELLAISGLLSWVYLLWFLLGYEQTGHLVVIVWTILTTDMVIFGCIASVVVVGFSLAFFLALTQEKERGVAAFTNQLFDCFHVMMSGGFDKDAYPAANSIMLTLFVAYSVLVTVLLLNLLIAMMGNTFTRVSDQAKEQWQLERARIISSIEQEMSPDEFQKHQYWLMLDQDGKGPKRYLEIFEVDDEWKHGSNKALPPGWQELQDSSGSTFYVNLADHTTQTTPPTA